MGRCACGHEELRGGKLVSMQLADEPALRGRFVMTWRDSGSRLVAKLTGTRVDGLYRRLRYVLYDGPGRGTLMESRYDPEQEVKAFRTRKAAEAEKARVERVERKAARAWKKEGKA